MTEYTRENMPDDLRWLAENVSEWSPTKAYCSDDGESLIYRDCETRYYYCAPDSILAEGNPEKVYTRDQWLSARQQLGLEPESVPEDVEKYSKYYKDVRHLDYIDVYRTVDLFGCEKHGHPISHAAKKLLLSGVRTGGKAVEEDVREAIDTLNRWLQMREEDKNAL